MIFQLYVFLWYVFNLLFLVCCNIRSIEHYKLRFTAIGSFWIWKANSFFSRLFRINSFQVHLYYWGQLLFTFREGEIHKWAKAFLKSNFDSLKVRKSWKQFMVSSILPKTNENHFPEHFFLYRDAQDSDFRSFFGRVRKNIICLRDFLTF